MGQKLTVKQVVLVSCMLFSIFFGAGNMIFPPMLAHMAGVNTPTALLGFIIADAGFVVLSVVAVVLSGRNMQDLASRAGKGFALVISAAVYLLIGPLFALPRTGSVSYELGVVPFLPEGFGGLLPSVIYTAAFFALTYFLSLNPSKIVDVVGKVLTPFLLFSIFLIFIAAYLSPVGAVGPAAGEYQTIPFFKGVMEGYLALDGFAGLVFAVTLTSTFKGLGIRERKPLLRYTLLTGTIAAIMLTLVYMALAYVGIQTSSMAPFANGGALLSHVVNLLFGKMGNLVLAVAVILACLTTSIGLTTSFGDYFAGLFPKLSYRGIILGICAFSFVLANVGLATLIAVVLPILIALYPVVTVMVLLSLFEDRVPPAAYWLGMGFAFAVSLLDGLHSIGIRWGIFSVWMMKLPMVELGMGWLLPAVVGVALGWSPLGRLLDRRSA